MFNRQTCLSTCPSPFAKDIAGFLDMPTLDRTLTSLSVSKTIEDSNSETSMQCDLETASTVVLKLQTTSGDADDDSDSNATLRENSLRAWLTVFGAFLALFCSFGQLNSFGTFQSWYSGHQLAHMQPTTISWIGSIQLWVFFVSVSETL